MADNDLDSDLNILSQMAGRELAGMGGAPEPQAAKGTNPLAAFAGNAVKTVGLLGLAATIPGFGEGYVAGQARRAQAAEQDYVNTLNIVRSNPEILLQAPEMQKRSTKVLGKELTQFFTEKATNLQAQQQVQSLLEQFAGTQGPQIETPAIGAMGESVALATPTGNVVVGGEAGVRPIPALGALAQGTMQETLKFTPRGTEKTLKPTPSTELERRARVAATGDIAKNQRELMRTYGISATEARVEALQQAQRFGADMSQLSPEDRALLGMDQPSKGGVPGAPGASTLRIEQEVTARETATRRAQLKKPPAGTYVNPKTFETFPSNVTLGDIEAAGGIKVDAQQKRALVSAKGMDRIAKDLKEAAAVLFTTDDPAAAFKAALQFRVGSKTRGLFSITGDPKRDQEIIRAVTKLQSLRGDAGELARSRSGEVGVLTQQDIERVFETIPGLRAGSFDKFFETRTTAEELLRILDQRIMEKKNAILGTGPGDDGFTVQVEPD